MDATDLAFAGIARQAELIAAGEISSRELVQLYLDRIERHDKRLNAYKTVFAERALMEADQADARRRIGSPAAQRPLLGVPIAIKDDTDVAGEVTSFGTRAAERPASADQEVVRRLREAGAVILGKTNVPELTLWPFTETPTFGITRNPWNLEHTPGGSSGGSGAAVAAGLVGRRARLRRSRLDPHSLELLRPVRDQASAPPDLACPPYRAAVRLARSRRVRADRAQCPRRRAVPRSHRTNALRAGQLRRGGRAG